MSACIHVNNVDKITGKKKIFMMLSQGAKLKRNSYMEVNKMFYAPWLKINSVGRDFREIKFALV